MHLLQVIKEFLLGNLTRQVTTIHSGGLSPLCRRLFILAYIIVLFRATATSVGLHFDIAAYFELDVINRQGFYQNPLRTKHIEYFLHFIPGFSARLFYLNYFAADGLVWSHLYDLVARNRDQVKLQWLRSSSEVFLSIWSAIKLKISKSSKLLYYPNLKRKQRIRSMLICFAFEGMSTFTISFIVFFIVRTHYVRLIKEQLSAVQVLFIAGIFLASAVEIALLFTMIFLVMMTLVQVSLIYVDQYRKVNVKLANNAKDRLNSESGGDHQPNVFNSLKTSLAATSFRTGHTRLTVFILHYNESTISKIIAATLHYILPFHAFVCVLIYFQSHDMPRPFIINLSFGLVILWLYLMALNLLVARVNNEISRSGPTVGAIFARKGVLIDKGIQGSWFNNPISTWSREALKLSTYYEMIWRCDKELAFTAGRTATMNWMFIVDVSL